MDAAHVEQFIEIDDDEKLFHCLGVVLVTCKLDNMTVETEKSL